MKAAAKSSPERLLEFLDGGRACLIAGAGVGVKAGLPTWKQFMEGLADVAETFEPPTATLMRLRISEARLAAAASYYFLCDVIPAGKKLSALAEPFSNYDHEALFPLVSLPFKSIVTTNFDRSLWDADAGLARKTHPGSPLAVELGDGSMGSAISRQSFVVARLHGRAELPETMKLSTEHFEELIAEPSYHDYLAHVVKSFDTLWVGFSFVDPALKSVLDSLARHLPTPLPGNHLALLPAGHLPQLRPQLASWNIEIIEYDPSEDHEALWRLFEDVHRLRRGREAPTLRETAAQDWGLARFLASSYARMSLSSDIIPLRRVVLEGIVSQMLTESEDEWVAVEALYLQAREVLSLPEPDLRTVLDDALEGLVRADVCVVVDNQVALAKPLPDRLGPALGSLAAGLGSRLKVREGEELAREEVVSLRTLFEELFFLRGFDLGAHFASHGRSVEGFQGWVDLADIIRKHFQAQSQKRAGALTRVLIDLLQHPNETEAEILADLGRVSFAVELVLNNANEVANLGLLLPDAIYLDASVLMPAIAVGHPYSGAYTAAIQRIQTARPEAPLAVMAAREFLNEIVSHRRAALEIAKEANLSDREVLRRQLLYYGPVNTNVYLAAFGGQGEVGESFEVFLARVAPFSNEEELDEYLEERGIRTVDLTPRSAKEQTEFTIAREALRSERTTRKADVLLDHEARQLVRLRADSNSRRRPMFITADRGLMRACGTAALTKYGRFILSDRGLLQLVDMLLGLNTDKRAMARLIWSVDPSDDETRVRNYLIDLALRRYDDAMAMTSWQVVGKVAKGAASAMADGRMPRRVRELSDVKASMKFLDAFENDFFKEMERVIRRRESED